MNMSWLKRNSLMLLILIALVMGWLTPEWGANRGYLHSEILIRIGVVFIFFSQGFSLSTSSLIDGLKYWPLHLFTQVWIFVGVPGLALAGIHFVGDSLPEGLKLGIFFLSILPTTVSSAVVLVSHAEGNVAGAIFNTVFSNLAAVFILPFWIVGYQSSLAGVEIDGWFVFFKLVRLLLIPFFIGHFSRPLLMRWEPGIKRYSRMANQGIIGFIVYAAFATSFRDRVWSEVGSTIALESFAWAIGLLLVASGAVYLSARLIFSESGNRIAAFFTASQKSLAVGIPYSVAFFSTLSVASDPSLKQSIIILPILFYHPAQILLAGVFLHFKPFFFHSPEKPKTSH